MKLKNYLRDRRGVASIEAAFGTVAILTASLLALDLYRLASTQTTTMYTAVSLADTVSREEPRTTQAALRQKMDNFVQSLAEFLHQERFPTSDATFVVSAVYKSPDNPAPSVLWTKTVVLGPDDGQAPEPISCSQDEIDINGQAATLPADFTMADHGQNEIVIVAEVCVNRTNTAFPGAVYAHYIVPSRDFSLAEHLGVAG